MDTENIIASYVEAILKQLGLNEEPGMKDTPKRFSRYLLEFNRPYDPNEVLRPLFPSNGIHNMVVQKHIPFRGLCEHHLAPMTGHASFGYIPNRSLVGLSKITRLIQAVGTSHPSIQEAMGEEVLDVFCDMLDPKGAICVIEAEHTCMTARGVNAPGVITTTSGVRGVFRDVPQARQEFFSLIGR